jgi:phenylacetate-coenzyme A ligase PaaK-like adenylate-forming protein
MAEYEALRAKHLADFLPIMLKLAQRLGWSREQIDEERNVGLRRLIAEAREKSAWHVPRLQHVDIESLTTANISDVPTMTKDDLMSNWDDIVTDRRLNLKLANKHIEDAQGDAYLLDEYHVVASGGSSGRRGVFAWGWDAWAMGYAALTRWMFRYTQEKAPPGAVPQPLHTAVVAAEGATHMTSAMTQTFTNPMVTIHRFSVMKPMHEIVTGLNELQPTGLAGYSSSLYELAHEAKAGRLRIAPKTVGPTAEPLLPEMRKALEAAWGAPVGGTWGISEASAAGQCCMFAGGMHLAEDLMLVEPVDAEGRAVRPGETSAKILLTNFMNPLMPLIRYEITDQVRVLEEPCPCGSVFARVDDVQGRTEDVFRYEGGTSIHPLVFDSPLSRRPEVVDYQVLQTADGAEIKLLVEGEADLAALNTEIVANLENAGLTSPVITLSVVDGLERTAAGKLKRFVSR